MVDAKKIAKLLLRKYPEPKTALNFSNTFELLISTILSARCTDLKVNEVTGELFKKYKSAGDLAGADIGVLAGEIRSIGFYRNKSKMIKECSRKIVKDFKGKVPETLEELTLLPGVGRKTANVVLGSAFGKQTMAVDTHVLRVSNRLGLADSNNPDRVEEALQRQLPQKRLTALNLALILHGRETCLARKPRCPECVLYSECEWQDKGG